MSMPYRRSRSASAWTALRFHCQGPRCQPIDREQRNIARAEGFGTAGYRNNAVGKWDFGDAPHICSFQCLLLMIYGCYATKIRNRCSEHSITSSFEESSVGRSLSMIWIAITFWIEQWVSLPKQIQAVMFTPFNAKPI